MKNVYSSEDYTISEPLRKKYQRFLAGNFIRVLFSRFFSFIYIIIFARLVAKAIMDQVIILAAGHQIITQIAIFSMRYACQQKALSTTEEMGSKIRYNATIFMLVVATPLSVIMAFPVTYYVVGMQHPELFITYPLSLALIIIKEIEVMISNSQLAVEKAALLNMIYSILNSILVPLFYFLFPSIESILWAWNVGLIITTIFGINILLRVLTGKQFDLKTIQDLFRFVFPLYLVGIPNPLVANLNSLIIYENLEEGATTIFYWPNRILSIASEVISILLAGIQELFTYLRVNNKETLRDAFLAIFRLIAIVSSVIFLSIYLNAALLINLLLGPGYSQAIRLFRFLCFAWIFTTTTTVLASLKNAEGHRRVLVKVNLLKLSTKFLFLLILIQFGLEGVVIAEIIYAGTIFSYYAINIGFFRKNDNFIRLGGFIIIIAILSIIGSSIEIRDLVTLLIVNLSYIGITSVLFLVFRPLTNFDINYIRLSIPIQIQWVLNYYRPSKSIYDK